jgi:hypothetical protein
VGKCDSIVKEYARIYNFEFDSVSNDFIPLKSSTDEDMKHFLEKRVEFLKIVEGIEKQQLSLNIEYIESDYIIDKDLENFNKNFDFYYFSLWVVIISGFGFSIRGYSKWKQNLQRYQDLIIQKQAGVAYIDVVESEKPKEENVEEKKRKPFFRRFLKR